MPQADEFTQTLQPGQHTIFQRVGERNGVRRIAGFVHVPDDGGNLFQLPLAELGERRATINRLKVITGSLRAKARFHQTSRAT